MDKSNAAQPLIMVGDHPADIMNRVSNVAAFLEESLGGSHVKPDGVMTLHPEAMSGLCQIIGFIQSAAYHASVTCQD